MTRFRRISALLVAALLTALLLPASALAATENSTIEVQIWPDGQPGYTLLIVTVDLGDDVELPVDVLLPLPDNAQVIWAGEIVGSDPNNDIERTAEVVTGDAGPAVKLTLETTGTAQYEAIYLPLMQDGDTVTASLDWFQTVPSAEVFFSVRIPPNTGAVIMDPPESGIPQTNNLGERLFTLAPLAVPLGEHFEVNVSYDLVDLLVSDESDSGTDLLLPILGAVLVVVVALLLIVVQKQRSNTVLAAEDEYEDEQSDEEFVVAEPESEPAPSLHDESDDDEGFLD